MANAPVKDIENQISALEKIADQLNNSTATGTGEYIYAGQKYSQKQLASFLSAVKKDISSLKKSIKPVLDAREKLKSASATGPFQKMSPQQKKIVDTARMKLSNAEAGTYTLPELTGGVPSTTEVTTAATTEATSAKPTNQLSQVTSALPAKQVKPDNIDNTGNNTNNTNNDAGRKPRDYGNKKPAKAIEGDTYTNSKNVKFTFKGGKYVRTATLTEKVDDTTSDAWKTIVQEEFGSLWDVYNMNPDVKKVLDDAVKGGYQDDEVKMEAKLQSTSWYRTTQQSARQWAVQQSTDPATAESRVVSSIEELRVNATNLGFTFNDETLRKLATDSIKFGWSDQQKLNALGSEQVASAQLGGAQGMADLRQSSVGRNLRAKAAAYYQKPSEEMIGSWTQQILTGQKSEVQFEETMRGSARTQFRSLQPALDKGEDVETAMYAYTQQAKSILGKSVDTSQIDWTQDKWNKALNFQDAKTGEYRQMDLWEWNKYLRTLPEWQNTDEAKSAYGDLAISLARGFGKTA
jgi:hypothetical protein